MAIEDRNLIIDSGHLIELVLFPPVRLDDWLTAFRIAREELEERHEQTRSVTVRIATDAEISRSSLRANRKEGRNGR